MYEIVKLGIRLNVKYILRNYVFCALCAGPPGKQVQPTPPVHQHWLQEA